jgi:hypothetical protein
MTPTGTSGNDVTNSANSSKALASDDSLEKAANLGPSSTSAAIELRGFTADHAATGAITSTGLLAPALLLLLTAAAARRRATRLAAHRQRGPLRGYGSPAF